MVERVYAAPVDLSKEYGYGYITSVADAFSHLIPLGFTIAGLAIVFFVILGAVKIISAGDNKDAISDAQKMVTHAIVGFILLLMMFLLLKFITAYFGISFNLFPG